MTTGDIWRVAVQGFVLTDQIVNVFHYQDIGTTPVSPLEVATGWESEVLPLYAACLHASWVADLIGVRLVTDPSIGIDYAITDTGDRGLERLPPMDAALISWRTAFFGRSYRGRTYLAPVSEQDSNGGFLQPAYQLVMQAFVDGAIEYSPGVGQALHLNIWSPTLSLGTPVTNGLVRPIMGTQRRRRPGVGS